MVKVLLILIVLVNGFYAVMFFRDFLTHQKETWSEPGNPIALAVWGAVCFFLSTFGISDFALSTVLYRVKKWCSDANLPGTLNTQCAIPVAVMALCYISSIEVNQMTLVLLIVSQMIGAYVGPKILVSLPVRGIRTFMGFGLLAAAFFVVAGKFGILPGGGEATALTGGKLILGMILLCIYGALNNLGVGAYAPTMATVYALGLSPAVAFPIMMGACTFSVPVGAVQFVKLGRYSRKITFFSSTFGLLGVLAAVFLVKSMDTSMLQWLVAAVILIAGLNLLHTVFTTSGREDEKEETDAMKSDRL